MSTSVRGIRFKNSSPAVPVLVPLWSSVAESIPFETDGTFTCGSSPKADVQISLRGVRADHCRLNLTNGSLTITSGDGPVWINDLPVTRNAPVIDGDVLSVGPASFRVEWMALPTATPPRQSVSRVQMDPHGRDVDGIAAGKRETHDPVSDSASPPANQSVWHPFSTGQGADSSVRKSDG
ncbi:MAG: FHA domain-containing protein, partial [Planctomyces sp.]